MNLSSASNSLEFCGPVDAADLAALRESIRTVLDEQCGSRQIHAFIDGEGGLAANLWSQAAELGWLAVGIPQSCGGLGLGFRGLDVLHSELGRRAAPGPFAATLSAATAIALSAARDVAEQWLPAIAAGEAKFAVPAVLHGAGAPRTLLLGAPDGGHAVIQRNGEWVIAELSGAGRKVDLWDRTRDLFEPEAGPIETVAVLGPQAGAVLARAMNLALAADAVAGARSISELTVAYLKERRQFDRIVGSFQALKHRAADLFMTVTTQEHVVAQALDLAVSGSPDADGWAALAKAEAVDGAVFVTADCIQLHGGVGFTWEYDPHIFLKRTRLSEMLVARGNELRDLAAEALAEAARAGRSTLELALS